MLHPKERHNHYGAETDAAIPKNYRFIARCLRYFQPARTSVLNIEISETKLNAIISAVEYKNEPAAISAFEAVNLTIVDNIGEALPEISGNSNVIIFCNLRNRSQKKLWTQLRSACSYGADFSDLRRGILCRFKHIPRQSYKIVIR